MGSTAVGRKNVHKCRDKGEWLLNTAWDHIGSKRAPVWVVSTFESGLHLSIFFPVANCSRPVVLSASPLSICMRIHSVTMVCTSEARSSTFFKWFLSQFELYWITDEGCIDVGWQKSARIAISQHSSVTRLRRPAGSLLIHLGPTNTNANSILNPTTA